MKPGLCVALALISASPARAQEAQVTSHDINTSVDVIEKFRTAAQHEPENVLKAAINVCRIALSESLRGLHETADAIQRYDGPRREVLSLMCNGYMQAAYDVLKIGSDAKPPWP